MQINAVDICVIAFLAIGAVRGLVRGLSREVADLFRLVGAFLVATLFYAPLGVLLFEKSRLSEIASAVVAFLILLLAAFLLLSMLHHFLSRFMQFAFKGPLERIGGLTSGIIKGFIVSFVIVMLVSFWPHEDVRTAVSERSVFGNWVVGQYPRLYEQLAERYPLVLDIEQNLSESIPSIMKSPEVKIEDQEAEGDSDALEPDYEY